jgi:hypothetical protein
VTPCGATGCGLPSTATSRVLWHKHIRRPSGIIAEGGWWSKEDSSCQQTRLSRSTTGKLAERWPQPGEQGDELRRGRDRPRRGGAQLRRGGGTPAEVEADAAEPALDPAMTQSDLAMAQPDLATAQSDLAVAGSHLAVAGVTSSSAWVRPPRWSRAGPRRGNPRNRRSSTRNRLRSRTVPPRARDRWCPRRRGPSTPSRSRRGARWPGCSRSASRCCAGACSATAPTR